MTYSEEIPSAAGYYVYRFWAADDTCLYVGRIGDRGPRSPQPRFRHHRRGQTWWPDVARIEVAEFPDHPAVVAEETGQIDALRPLHNARRGNCHHDLSLPGAVKPSGGCRECANEYSRKRYHSPVGAAYEATPARKAQRREAAQRYRPKDRAAERLRQRRPSAGQAPLW